MHKTVTRLLSFVILISVIALSSCLDEDTKTTPETPSQSNAPSADDTIESLPTHPITQSISTITATSSETLSIITPTHTPTPPAFLSIPPSYDLPHWFSEFDHTILMTISDVTEYANRITFVDANLSEHYDIWLSKEDLSAYFWTPDGLSFGFLSRNLQTVYLVDALTGEVDAYANDNQAIACLQEYFSERPENLDVLYKRWVYAPSPESVEFFCGYQGEYIPSHTSEYIYVEDQLDTLIISDVETGQKVELKVADPANGLYQLASTANWKIDPPLKVVLQGGADLDALGTWMQYFHPGDRILIFDLSTGNLIASFEGEFVGTPKWSPDDTQLLAIKDGMPCVIDVASLAIECLDLARSQGRPPRGDTFYWSADSIQIYYGQRTDDRGDVCIYDLPSDNIFCPTSELEVLDGLAIEFFTVSPDDKFFRFLFGSSCNGCDYWGEPSSGIIHRDGTVFYFFGDESLEHHYPFYSSLFRPLIDN